MAARLARANPDLDRLGDLELAALAAGGDLGAVRLVTSGNNQRLYRAAWSILKNRAEAEEAVQEGYLKAFRAIAGFTGAASLSTWLTRIVVNEALARRSAALQRERVLREASVRVLDQRREGVMSAETTLRSPEAALIQVQLAQLLEAAVARLPDVFRPVFVLREIEGLSVEETAAALGVPARTVKTRLFRARARLRQELGPELRAALTDSVTFAGPDCEAMTERIVQAVAAEPV